MTGKSTASSVDRVFRVIGALFLFGGLYLGTLMYANAPEVYEVEGVLTDLRVEKSRPFGYEDIPVDSTDPEHAHIPLNVNTYGTVRYTWQGDEMEGQIVSWDENIGWEAGDSISLYLVSGEEDVPLNYFPAEAAGEKRDALIVGIAASAMGIVLFLFGFFSPRIQDRKKRELLNTFRERQLRTWQPPRIPMPNILYSGTYRGNGLVGVILTGLGTVLAVLMIGQIVQAGSDEAMYSVFPLLLGLGLLYLGSFEFFREDISMTNTDVRVVFRSLWKRYDETVSLSTFAAIRQARLDETRAFSLKKRYWEYRLLHRDFRFDDLPIQKVPRNRPDEDDEAEGKKISSALGLPVIKIRGDEIKVLF